MRDKIITESIAMQNLKTLSQREDFKPNKFNAKFVTSVLEMYDRKHHMSNKQREMVYNILNDSGIELIIPKELNIKHQLVLKIREKNYYRWYKEVNKYEDCE